MQERERHIVTGLVVLLLVLALGFYVHRDPRFPGSLAAMMIVVALSGFIGRYLMNRISTDMRQQQQLLAGLRVAYDRVAAELTQDAGQAAALRPFAGFFGRLVAGFFVGEGGAPAQ